MGPLRRGYAAARGLVSALLLVAGLLSGCTGAVLQRVQDDLEALRHRVHAREEVRIHVASAEPVVKHTSRGEPTDPHLTVAVPPCPPAVVRPVTHRHAAKAKRHRGAGRGRR